MKAYKFEVIVIDHEDYGSDEYKTCIEQARDVQGSVIDVKEAEIGEWHDKHPLNYHYTPYDEIIKFFKEKED